MSNAKVSAVKNLMVVGKLLILLSGSILFSTTATAAQVNSPTFYSYSSGPFVNKLISMSFGFFRTLNDSEETAYQQAVNHAVMYANNGETVEWFRGRAAGTATPVFTWPINGGYCRRVHIQTFAYDRERTQTATACFSSESWRWVRSDK